MPDGQKDDSVVTPIPSGDGTQSVSYESYQRSVSQVKAAKAKEREAQEKLNEVLAEREASKKASLEEQQRFKELYNQSEAKHKEVQGQLDSLIVAEGQRRKRDAVASMIGSVHKPEFLNFIKLDSVDLDNPESIVTEANRFKSEYPMALKTAKTETHTNVAPGSATIQSTKPVSEWTDVELDAAFNTGIKEGAY